MMDLRSVIEHCVTFREKSGQTFKNRDKAVNDTENAVRRAIVEAITKSLDEAERG